MPLKNPIIGVYATVVAIPIDTGDRIFTLEVSTYPRREAGRNIFSNFEIHFVFPKPSMGEYFHSTSRTTDLYHGRNNRLVHERYRRCVPTSRPCALSWPPTLPCLLIFVNS